jgi:undecaprenyl-diphosphatase
MDTARTDRNDRPSLAGHELNWLVVGFAVGVLLLAFVMLAGQVMDGHTQALDNRILRGLRNPSDPFRPIGPAWIEGTMFDLTALGGSTVLWLVSLAAAGFLLLQTRYRTAIVILAATGSGEVLNAVIKHAFNRPRPDIVPHLRPVYSTSFPSGHAMESAIVYLTLGAILMRASSTRATKIYVLAVAVVLTMLAGASRVYLGVHYPTDVIGGWIVGFMWASVCWVASRRFESTTHIQSEKTTAP